MRARPCRLTAGLLGLALLFLPAMLLARAGGGGDYRGPGGGGGEGGGGGAIVWFAFRLILWAFRVNPIFGLLVLGTIIALLVHARRRMPGPATRRAVEKLDRARFVGGDALASATAGLAARDPEFDEKTFLARVGEAFVKVQAAWSAADLRPARPFLSDALWNRFQVLLEINRRHGRRNVLSDVAVDVARVVAVVPGDDFDELHVRIDARARDTDVPDGAGAGIAEAALAKAPLDSFVEVWSFLRRSGTRTRAGKGALEGSCPSCGAPLALADVVACSHCGSLVNSGVHDWVLAEITQAEVWSGASAAPVPGLDALRARDPQASRQVLEDRASLLFWRWLETLVRGDPAGLRKLAAPEFFERHAAGLTAAVELDRLAVGSADLVLVSVGDDWERAHVQVRWSALARGASESAPRSHVLVLRRKAGTRALSAGLRSASCPQCGGPLSRTDSPSCDYCNADLSAASGEFVLEDVANQSEWMQKWGQAPRAVEAAPGLADEDDLRIQEILLPDPSVPAERERLVHALVLAAAADGRYARGEQRLLRAAARRFAVPAAKLDAWMDAALATPGDGALGDGAMATPLLVRSLATAALVDGKVDRRERALLERVGAHGGLTPEAVGAIVASQAERIARRAVPSGVIR